MVARTVLRGARNGFNDFSEAAMWLGVWNLNNLGVLSVLLRLGLGLEREARIVGREKWRSGGGGNLRGREDEGRWGVSGGRW